MSSSSVLISSPSSTTAVAILQCAKSLILNGGYSGFSYADIAEVVGIRKASIHHHFPTKADLVQKLVYQHRVEAEAGLAYLEEHIADPVAQLRAYIEHWNKCITDMTLPICVCALLASQIPVLPEEVAYEVRMHFDTMSKWLAAVMKRGVKQGSIQLSGSAKTEADMFLATVHGAMLSARASGEPAIFQVITSTALKRLITTA